MSDYLVRKVFTQSGVSLAVVIPKDYAEELGLVNGSEVYISLQGDVLVLKKIPDFNLLETTIAVEKPLQEV